MKTKSIMVAAVVLAFATASWSQTADNYVTLGRGYLTATNLAAANDNFSHALVLSPSNQPANVLYAVTRLLMLPSQPAGSNFLNRLGMPAAGRDIYQWTAGLPLDANGLPLMPGDVNADEFTAQLRTGILPSVIAAEANLARVTDTNFTLNLTADETRITAVTLDYGDIQMLRALLQAFEYACYNACSWNISAQYVVIYSLLSENQFSLERMLKDHPQLLTFATTNDLNLARAALTNGIDRYFAASQFIRARNPNVTRLFNYSAGNATGEQNFRVTLADLKQSLNGIVTLTASPDYSVHLPSLFSGTHPPRSLLPEFVNDTFVLGTLPDPTFGGFIYGLSRQQEESFLAANSKHTVPIPRMDAPLHAAGQPFQFSVHTLVNRGYVVETSTNLQDWTDFTAFFGLGDIMSFSDPTAAETSRRYYRVEDRTAGMPPPGNDNFAGRIPLTGLGITAAGYNVSATSELYEPGYPYASVWWSWTAPVSGLVEVATVGSASYPQVTIFTGFALNSLTAVGYGNSPFIAVAGTTYQIQVSSGWESPGGIQIEITMPPVLTVTSPLNGMTFPAGTNITLSAWSYDYDGTISRLEFYADETLLGRTTNSSISLIWSNVPAGYHNIHAQATDNLGVSTTDYLNITVPPPNDSFTKAIPIVGSAASVTGSNAGATTETGEPNHAGQPGGASVWWSWTAPFTGPVTINTTLGDQWGSQLTPLLEVYTGNVVSNLTAIASNVPYVTAIPAQVSFTASSGTTYKIAVDGEYGGYGNITLKIIPTAAPTITMQSPTSNMVFLTAAPTANVALVANASDSDGTIRRVDFYGYNGNPFLIGSVSNRPYSLVWSNLNYGGYWVAAAATDNSGVTNYSDPVYFTVAPPTMPNDNFASRILLGGSVVTTNGNNTYATRETGEPYHNGYYGGKSVWWSWVAPSNGTYTVTVSTTSAYYPILAVYTGTQLSGLAGVASGMGWSYYLQVSFSATSGQAYQIAVDDYYGNGSDYNLSISQ